jgi:hypothetical protein
MPFFRHPTEVGMTYLEHMRFSLWLSTQLAGAAAASLVHAFIPDVLERTSSSTILRLAQVLRAMGCHEDVQQNLRPA